MRSFTDAALAGTALASILAATSVATPCLAQSTESSTSSTTLQEVVVTAEKRASTVARTPLAISAFDQNTLHDAGVISVTDIQNIAPSVQMGRDTFGVNINIRGVTSTDNTSKGDQGIAFNVDNIPIGRPIEEGLSFFDVARVEVLRGPQGTLYGKSSTGGAINVVTNAPNDEFSATGDVEFGNYDTRRGDAVLNGPVTAWLDLRAAFNFNEREGYLKTSLAPSYGSVISQASRNDEDDQSGRISALVKINPQTTLRVTYSGGYVGGVGQTTAIFDRVEHDSGDAERAVYGNPFGANLDDHFNNINGEFNAGLGFVHLTYDGAHLEYSAHELTSSNDDPDSNGPVTEPGAFGATGYSPPYQPGDPTQPGYNASYNWRDYRGKFLTDSHEVRLSNASRGPVDFVVGLNWYKEDITESDHNWSAPYQIPTLAASVNAIDPLDHTTHTTYGVFGQATWHITNVFSAVLGLREAHDEVNRIGTFAAPFENVGATPPVPFLTTTGIPCQAPYDCVGAQDNGRESDSKLTYRVGLNAQLTARDLLYVSVATGYKAGGFNDFGSTVGAPTYAPEAMTAYELGYKGRPLSNLRITSAFYYYDYSSDQISSLIYIGPAPVIDTRSAQTTIYGWENEFNASLTAHDLVDGALALEHSEYNKFMVGPTLGTSFAGKSLDKTPAAVLTLGYNHTWDLPSGAFLKARIGTKYSTSYKLSDFVNAEQYEQKAYTRSDFTLGYTAPGGKMTLEVFVHNLEDKLQAQSFVAATTAVANVHDSSGATAAVSEPRFYGVRLGLSY